MSNEIEKIVNLLYKKNDKGYIAIFRKGYTKVYTKYFKANKVLEGVNDYLNKGYNTDLYWSMNTFYKPNRTLENLRYINALYIDLDYYNTSLRKESILYFLNEDYFNKSIPTPSLIVDSGKGLQLVWFIKPVPSQAYSLWKAMQWYLYNALKDFGADISALDASRVLRIPGTINTKNDSKVTIEELNDYSYDLKELKAEYLPEVKKKRKHQSPMRKHISFSEQTLYEARVHDLKKLVELRGYDIEGRRELLLYLFRYYTTLAYQNEQLAEQMTDALNNSLVTPISQSELKSTRSNYIGKYRYTNKYLIELFQITEDEMTHMKSIINKQMKYKKNNDRRRKSRRGKDGLTNREREKKSRLLQIARCLIQKMSTKQIAEKIKLSTRMVQKYVKEIKDNIEILKALKEELKSENKKDYVLPILFWKEENVIDMQDKCNTNINTYYRIIESILQM